MVPLPPWQLDDVIEIGMAVQGGPETVFHRPNDSGLGQPAAQESQRGKRAQDVAEGAEPDHEQSQIRSALGQRAGESCGHREHGASLTRSHVLTRFVGEVYTDR